MFSLHKLDAFRVQWIARQAPEVHAAALTPIVEVVVGDDGEKAAGGIEGRRLRQNAVVGVVSQARERSADRIQSRKMMDEYGLSAAGYTLESSPGDDVAIGEPGRQRCGGWMRGDSCESSG
jgi:hypothetical protein